VAKGETKIDGRKKCLSRHNNADRRTNNLIINEGRVSGNDERDEIFEGQRMYKSPQYRRSKAKPCIVLRSAIKGRYNGEINC